MLDDATDTSLNTWLRAATQKRLGRDYIYDNFESARTALIVVDMQNFFMKQGFLAACPLAIDTVPAVNQLAQNLRQKGGVVVWIQTTAEPEATKDWGVYQALFTPENWQRRNVELAESHEGYALWSDLDTQDGDVYIKKTRFSAFIHGSSDLDGKLKARNIDTLLIAGVATDICCESTARDGMMLNYRTIMVADALAAKTIENHKNALKAVFGQFADVQNGDEISARLS
ncbi:MAG: cysteine hydrolase [Rhodospirillaceae bacterium]|jgi:ureidoacrylate peracid hydrolase|nr:cysteine hydrolase [Rhodospirillaceae bacterium]